VDALQDWTQRSPDEPRYPSVQEEAWLIGQPTLQRYLDYVTDDTLDGAGIPSSQIVDEWRVANDYYHELEAGEAGAADGAEIRDVDSSLMPLVEEVRSDYRFRRAFSLVPTRIAVVELARLVVCQPHVNLTHCERLKARIGRDPDPADLFRFCLPLDRPDLQVKTRRTGDKRYTFWSDTVDFRYHEHVLLDPSQVSNYDGYGPVGGIVAIILGLGSNFFNVIESDRRLVLNNAHHRALALMELGITHAPCLVQTVTRRDELDLVAHRNIQDTPAFYFKAARPPLLRDFLDPKLRKVHRVPRMQRMIDVTFDVTDYLVRE
jgi:hypothetical protein